MLALYHSSVERHGGMSTAYGVRKQ